MKINTAARHASLTIGVIVGALGCSYAIDLALGSTVAVLLLLQLAVVVVAFQCHAKLAYLAAVIEAICFNFLFTTPRYSLQMLRFDDIMNLVVFVIVAVVISQMAERYKRQQNALNQAQLRNQILLSVSHDLRTPLATIIGTLSTLKEYMDQLSPQQTGELLDSATQESHRLHQYIENLLQATKLHHGVLKINREEESIVQILGLVTNRLAKRKTRVVLDPQANLPTLSISGGLIAQALYNVIDNGLRYSPDNSLVRVRAYQSKQAIVVEVKDEGVGFSKQQAQHMFELFYSTNAMKHSDSGSGLGLAVAKGIITAHQGEIEAIPLSTGSLFRITLPLPSGEPHCDL
ncbi:DUF4118 domain-containing protein [Vibrio sp. PP-XX7]